MTLETASGTAGKEEFVESITELLKRHEKMTRSLYIGACVTCGSGKGTDLQPHGTPNRAVEWNTLVGAAEGKAAVPWQSPNNTPQRRKREL